MSWRLLSGALPSLERGRAEWVSGACSRANGECMWVSGAGECACSRRMWTFLNRVRLLWFGVRIIFGVKRDKYFNFFSDIPISDFVIFSQKLRKLNYLSLYF